MVIGSVEAMGVVGGAAVVMSAQTHRYFRFNSIKTNSDMNSHLHTVVCRVC